MKSAFLQKGITKADQASSPALQYDEKGGRYTDVVIDEDTEKVDRTHGKGSVYKTTKTVSKGMSRNRQKSLEEALNRGDTKEGAHQMSLAKREGYGRMGKKTYISGSPGGPGPMTGSSIHGAKGIDKKSGLVIEDEKWGQKIAKKKGLFKPQPTASVTLMKGSPAKQPGISTKKKKTYSSTNEWDRAENSTRSRVQRKAAAPKMKGSPAKQGIGKLEKMTDRINRDKAKGKGKK